MTDRIYLYDSTLRDGAQARGVDFTLADKLAIARALDVFGIDYIEGGWPGANPKDDAFFAEKPAMKKSKLTAFGMTRKPGRSAANDPGLATLLQAETPSICIVGKTWDFHIEKALEITLEENQKMIEESVSYLAGQKKEVLFDAEHFFDGYKHNKTVALRMVKAAYDAGARWVVLCDTNGGSLPHEITQIVREVVEHIPGKHLGVHCHNDTDNAVANSLAAVMAGVRQVQGTINGIGERCGNANLISILANLNLKLGFDTGITEEKLKDLTQLSRLVDDRLSRTPNQHAPYVGGAAFAHKGGLHVSAMAKDTASYEHVTPESVGNERTILVSDKAGKSNIISRLKQLGLEAEASSEHIEKLVEIVKEQETQGYAYEGADASFELLARRLLTGIPAFYDISSFRVMDERRWNAKGTLVTVSEATVKLAVNGEKVMSVAEGNGPVNALDSAIRKSLVAHYPVLSDIKLTDYKVRILTPQEGTGAMTRVMIESRDSSGKVWNTIGVSHNVIDASFNALNDSLTYKLIHAAVH